MWQSLLDLDRELLLALNGDGGAFWDAFFYFVTARLTWIPLYAVLLPCGGGSERAVCCGSCCFWVRRS